MGFLSVVRAFCFIEVCSGCSRKREFKVVKANLSVHAMEACGEMEV